MRGRRLGRRGVAGFFEEVPAAVVAIVALLLFFTAVLVGLNTYFQREQNSQFTGQAETFLEGLLGYQNLTYEKQSGIFDVNKMDAITVANLTYDFHPPFQFEIIITDVSIYAFHYDRTLETGTPPASLASLHRGEVADSTTIQIWVPGVVDSYHPATLEVVIWE